MKTNTPWIPPIDAMILEMWGKRTPQEIAHEVNEFLGEIHSHLGHHQWRVTGKAGNGVVYRAHRLGLIDDSELHEILKRIKRKPLRRVIVKRILERDGGRCQNCGSTNRPEVHHIRAVADGGTDDDANLVTLCKQCHKKEWGEPPLASSMTVRYIPPNLGSS